MSDTTSGEKARMKFTDLNDFFECFLINLNNCMRLFDIPKDHIQMLVKGLRRGIRKSMCADPK